MEIREFFDQDTKTLTYVVKGAGSREAIVLDPVLDFDPASGRISEKIDQRGFGLLDKRGISPGDVY